MDVEAILSDGTTLKYPHPSSIETDAWKDNVAVWPKTTKEHITEYLIKSSASDGLPNGAYMSLEAIDFFVSGWVDVIKVYELDKSNIYLLGRVARSQSTTLSDHQPWLCCSREGPIVTASCTCMAGLGKVCSHVSALLFKVREANVLGLNTASCTDFPMQWNASSRKYVAPEKVKNLRKRKHHQNRIGVISPTKKFCQFYSKTEMTESLSSSNHFSLMNLPNSGWQSVINCDIEERKCSKPTSVQVFDHSSHDMNFQEVANLNAINCSICKDFYHKFVELSEYQIKQLNQKTINQSSSNLWEDSRRLRVTGSTGNKFPKKDTTDPKKFLKSHIYNTFKGCAATWYGSENEATAISKFSNIYDLSVKKTGTVVHAKEHWLSSSPDGLIEDHSVLEVKCPVRDLKDLVKSGKYDVKLNSDNELFLNKTGPNGYYPYENLTLAKYLNDLTTNDR